MNVYLILHLCFIVLLLLGIIIPAGMMRRAGGENRSRRRWLIIAGLGAVITMGLYIVDRANNAPDNYSVGSDTLSTPGNRR